jgi:hypothetical protein
VLEQVLVRHTQRAILARSAPKIAREVVRVRTPVKADLRPFDYLDENVSAMRHTSRFKIRAALRRS